MDVAEGVEFVAVRQFAVPEEVQHFLVTRVTSEVLYRIPAIDEFPLVAIDVAEC